MSIRIRRLQADYVLVQRAFAQHPLIGLVEAKGNPPEAYTFVYRVQGLIPIGEDQSVPGQEHRAQIFLPLDYPRRPPFCRMLTPVFHPNIDAQKICIGDHWTAGQSLAHMVAHIGSMICYQSYNVKSPLNARAAAWAELNLERLPLQKDDLLAGL